MIFSHNKAFVYIILYFINKKILKRNYIFIAMVWGFLNIAYCGDFDDDWEVVGNDNSLKDKQKERIPYDDKDDEFEKVWEAIVEDFDFNGKYSEGLAEMQDKFAEMLGW